MPAPIHKACGQYAITAGLCEICFLLKWAGCHGCHKQPGFPDMSWQPWLWAPPSIAKINNPAVLNSLHSLACSALMAAPAFGILCLDGCPCHSLAFELSCLWAPPKDSKDKIPMLSCVSKGQTAEPLCPCQQSMTDCSCVYFIKIYSKQCMASTAP